MQQRLRRERQTYERTYESSARKARVETKDPARTHIPNIQASLQKKQRNADDN
jgi:hypothetical protein